MPQTHEFRSSLQQIGQGHYLYSRYPGYSARSVRWAFYELEPNPPMEGSHPKNAMAALKKIVARGKKSDSQQGVSATQEAEGLTFDKLPFDIKAAIFETVQSTPNWVHIKFKRGMPVKVDAGNQEINVNKEWHQVPKLRQGLSGVYLKNDTALRTLTKRILGFFIRDYKSYPDLFAEYSDEHPFHVCLKHKVVTPRVRRLIDWFFFDGIMSMKPRIRVARMCWDFCHIRTCVLTLDHLYEMISLSWRDPAPWFIWPHQSIIEELVIIVGEFRKEVLPLNMKQIRAFWVDDLTNQIDRLKIDYGQDISNSDNYMMGCVTEALTSAILRKRTNRNAWLGSSAGRQRLAYKVHDESNRISKWLACAEGNKWLESFGCKFLASESGRWWLASDLGYPWLETERGMQWLDTEAGRRFLDSPQALLWANTDTYQPSYLTPLGTQVRKNWFKTPAGGEWKFSHCPNGNPPTPPQRPQRESNPPPDDESIPSYFINANFRGWRYVVCPREDAAQESGNRVPRIMARQTTREIIH
ncbi:hypothetical protein F5Y13DRAFT_199135 [Hypoxylon sp. FL1857]|nr:hypothetical protein F5Y13DRAFT_199135 [Hypoxylon sp. FL1857]